MSGSDRAAGAKIAGRGEASRSARSVAARAAAALGGMGALLFAAAGVLAQKAPAVPPRTHIKLVAPAYLTSAPFFVAADLGLFEAEGLDVEFVEIRHASASLPALAQGQIDVVGAMVGPALVNLISRGGPVKIVAARAFAAHDGCDAMGLMARKGLIAQGRLPSAAAMRGLRLSADRASADWFFISSVLSSGGLRVEDVTMSDVAIEVRSEAMRRDLIDVVFANEPWVARIIEDGSGEMWIPGKEIAPDFQFAYMLFGARLLGPDREAGRRFLRAYVRAVEMYTDQAKSPRLVEVLAAHTQLDPELLRHACWPPAPRDGHVDRSSLERYQAWAVQEGLLDARIDPDRLVDDGLLPGAAGAAAPEPAPR